MTPRRARSIRSGLSQARRDFDYLIRLYDTRQGIMDAYKALSVPSGLQRLDIVLSGVIYIVASLWFFVLFPMPFTAYGTAYRHHFIPAAKAWLEENN